MKIERSGKAKIKNEVDFKSQSGITLIALAITIIIIIILSTVTINMAFGDNGLIKQAQLAKDLTANSMEREQGAMANLIAYMNEAFGGGEIAPPDIPGEPDIPNGTIEFEEIKWVGDGTATVVVNTTSTGYRLQYQVNSTEGIWQETENGQPIPNLKHGDRVYARLFDGTNESEHVTKDILDETPPEVSISTSNLTYNSVTLNVTASDGQSGLADTETFTYFLGDVQQVANTANSYNYTGLNEQTQYTLKVVVKDRAGKTTEKTTSITTTAKPINASMVSQNPTAYYGKEVTGYTCTSPGVTTWRIFYADSTNIYLIADDYISASNAPNGQGGNQIYENSTYKLSFDNVYKDYTGASWINANSKGKKWLSQFLESNSYNTSSSINANIRAVAYMMDTNIWQPYAGTYAEYAMGGPTLEMFCASYKESVKI